MIEFDPIEDPDRKTLTDAERSRRIASRSMSNMSFNDDADAKEAEGIFSEVEEALADSDAALTEVISKFDSAALEANHLRECLKAALEFIKPLYGDKEQHVWAKENLKGDWDCFVYNAFEKPNSRNASYSHQTFVFMLRDDNDKLHWKMRWG